MKRCKTCNKFKSESEFYKHPTTKDGLFPECNECNIARTRRWQKEHPEEKKRLHREYWWRNREKLLKEQKAGWNRRDFDGLREQVLRRDNYRCVKCGITREEHLQKWGVDLNVDHINRNRKENTLKNLQTLCLICHGSKSGKDAKGISHQINKKRK